MIGADVEAVALQAEIPGHGPGRVEMEVADFLKRYADLKTKAGHQRIVRHGHLPEREIMTGIGSVAVRQPRVRDREAVGGERIRFSPTILPPYARRTKSLEVLIPILYLKGISTGDFEEALAALLGKDAGGLSASTIARLKEAWIDEHARWCDRDLSTKRYVYFWVDGIHVQARLEDDAQCLLVIIGATPEGKKELVGLIDGVRESAQSWKELLLDLKRRGLATGPELAVADGALGFWKALPEVWPKTREQRCWVHKTANVLNRLPKSLQGKAKRALQNIWMAETRNDAEAALDTFAEIYGTKYDKAVECLTKDRNVLLAFYDFPAEHWAHLRTTNPIESTFATVRHRTTRSKGCLSNKTALAMVFKLVEGAQTRRLPFAPLLAVDDLPRHEQLIARKFFVSMHGDVYPGAPYRFGATPWRLRFPAPGLDEHRDEILCELAGVDVPCSSGSNGHLPPTPSFGDCRFSPFRAASREGSFSRMGEGQDEGDQTTRASARWYPLKTLCTKANEGDATSMEEISHPPHPSPLPSETVDKCANGASRRPLRSGASSARAVLSLIAKDFFRSR